MIHPLERWRHYGEKPDYAGLLTFGGAPYTQDPQELEGVDVAVVGAPMDELCSDRPGARFGPRGIRAASCSPGPHAEPDIGACAKRWGAVSLIQFDAHTDTGTMVFGAERSHGTPMYRLVEAGLVDPQRYVQIGLRGYWPGEAEFAWQAERGITSFFMHDLERLGLDDVLRQSIDRVGDRPCFLSVDIDALDPAFAPGTGTPEPGGMSSSDLLRAARMVAGAVDLVGAEIVEVIPTAIGSADVTAVTAERIVREMLTGIALRRQTDNQGRVRPRTTVTLPDQPSSERS